MIESAIDKFWIDIDTCKIRHILLFEIFLGFFFWEEIITILIVFLECWMSLKLHLAKLSGVLGTILNENMLVINPASNTRHILLAIL